MAPDPPAPSVGHFPLAAFCAGLGLLVCSIANALSRSTETTTTLVYWAGLLLIVLPIFYRLTSKDDLTRERLALVCLLGLALYGVKVVHDSPPLHLPRRVRPRLHGRQDRRASPPLPRPTRSFRRPLAIPAWRAPPRR